MIQNLTIFQLASAMTRHAGDRQAIVAENIANADTPGFKARDLVPFADTFAAQSALGLRGTRPSHITNRNETVFTSPFGVESPNGNTVSLESEMMRMTEIRQQHDMAIGIYQKSLQILRTSMGRK
jgi:flagellar basal-body rod protein FlgB